MNQDDWCCADIVRTQSGIDLGSQDLYIARKAAAHDCVKQANKPFRIINNLTGKSRLDCKNNFSKDVNPIDSSIRTLGVQQKWALVKVDQSKLFITTGTSRIKHGGC